MTTESKNGQARSNECKLDCEGAPRGLPLLLFLALFAQAPRFPQAPQVCGSALRSDSKGTDVARMALGLVQSGSFVAAAAVAVGSNGLFCQLGRCAMGALLTHTMFGTKCGSHSVKLCGFPC